jgi:hypothetical protein
LKLGEIQLSVRVAIDPRGVPFEKLAVQRGEGELFQRQKPVPVSVESGKHIFSGRFLPVGDILHQFVAVDAGVETGVENPELPEQIDQPRVVS